MAVLFSGAVLTVCGLPSAHAALTDPISLWGDQSTPAVMNSGDSGSLELGLKFQSSLTGSVTGVKFYKGDLNIGTHVGNLWDRNGNNLASVTFTNESASGWQTATFATPVHISANTTYIISYFAPQGNFSIDAGYFMSGSHTSGPLTALQNGTDGANGVYVYNGSSSYPGNPSSSDNYWVDVMFAPDVITAPTGIIATQYYDSITIKWSPGTNASEVTQYSVNRNGIQIGRVDGDTFQYTDTTGLQPGGMYNYDIEAVDVQGVKTTPSNTVGLRYIAAHASVKAIDSANTITDPAWFTQAYDEGFRLYVMHSTSWGNCTPWYNTQAQLGMALDAGFKIAVYTRDPRCWQAGILATGQYQDKLQFFALDAETDPGVPITRAMVDGVRAMNVRPVIYTGSGMWGDIQLGAVNDFSDVPLWETNTTAFSYGTWHANYLAPMPIAYGGWNGPDTMRIGVQQQFEYVLNGVHIDLNSFNASFLNSGNPVAVPPKDVVSSSSSSSSLPDNKLSDVRVKGVPATNRQTEVPQVAGSASEEIAPERAQSSEENSAVAATADVTPVNDPKDEATLLAVPSVVVGVGIVFMGVVMALFVRYKWRQ